MFDTQALWTCRYILGKLPDEPKSMELMVSDIKSWLSRCENLTDCHAEIDFQTDFVRSIAESSGYNSTVTKSTDLFKAWRKHQVDDIATYRDHSHRSLFTGKESPLHVTPCMKSFDDSIEAFVGK